VRIPSRREKTDTGKLESVFPSSITAAVLSRMKAPFDHLDWIYELKYDGFRGLAYARAAPAVWSQARLGAVRHRAAVVDKDQKAHVQSGGRPVGAVCSAGPVLRHIIAKYCLRLT
jgi:hypothetical protein